MKGCTNWQPVMESNLEGIQAEKKKRRRKGRDEGVCGGGRAEILSKFPQEQFAVLDE